MIVITLPLTPAEKELWKAVPAEHRDAIIAATEARTFQDSAELQSIRRSLARFSSPKLVELVELNGQATPENLTSAMQAIDIESLPEEDRAELLFVLGPAGIGWMIESLIPQIEDEDDVGFIGMLAVARSGLLDSFLV